MSFKSEVKESYRTAFGGLFTILPSIAVLLLYVAVILATFMLLGPVSDIYWGWPTGLSLAAAILGTPAVAVVSWPLVHAVLNRLP